jgi:carboxypeptidase C (cathepsin A)
MRKRMAMLSASKSLRGNVRITYYPAGHMIYPDDAALHALKRDLGRFYDAGVK